MDDMVTALREACAQIGVHLAGLDCIQITRMRPQEHELLRLTFQGRTVYEISRSEMLYYGTARLAAGLRAHLVAAWGGVGVEQGPRRARQVPDVAAQAKQKPGQAGA